MLKKSRRLTTKQFNQVLKKGKISHSPLFMMRSIGGQSDTRISAVAPVKIAKTAVKRNAIRRKIYNAIVPIFLSLPNSVHIILFAKKDLTNIDTDDLSADIGHLMSKSV